MGDVQASRSKAEAACESVPSWRSVSCRCAATRLCTKESAFEGRPNSMGVSCGVEVGAGVGVGAA